MASSRSGKDIKRHALQAQQAAADSGGAAAKKQRQTPLLPLANDVAKSQLFPHMDTPSLAAFATSSFYASSLAQPELERRAVKKLFEHILEGDIDNVKKMLTARPRLASVAWKAAKGEDKTLANKAGQSILIEGKTAYEFALGEEDTEMAEILLPCIVKVENQEFANTLFYRQFPQGWEAEEEQKPAPIFAQLDALTQAISNAQPGDITSSGDPVYRLTVREGSVVAEALLKFRSMLDATLKETVTTGRHFNPNLLLRAFQIYDAHYDDYFGNDWSDPRAVAFWQQAIGYIQRCMPANYVQAFCNGHHNTHEKLKKGTPQSRSLKFETHEGKRWIPTNFYPLSAARLGLGFDFAIYARAGRWLARTSRMDRVPTAFGFFRSLCQSKTAGLQSLLSTKTLDVRRQDRVV